MNLIDTHAHLFWDSYKDDLDSVIQRAKDNNVTTIINVGVDLTTSDMVTKMTSDKLQFFASVGIHPEESVNYSSNEDVSIRRDVDRLEELILKGNLNSTKIVAIGECGLDYYFAENPWTPPPPISPVILANEVRPESEQDSGVLRQNVGVPRMTFTPERIKSLQKKLFQAQITLAKKHHLPLLIHCRDDYSKDPQNSEAWDLVGQMTKDYFGIYHCYSGLPPTTDYLLQNTKFLISFAGNATYPKNEFLREAIKAIPLERLTTETDCPFLPPQNNRGKRNEPANVLEVAKLIAEIKKISIEEVARQTTQNVHICFKKINYLN